MCQEKPSLTSHQQMASLKLSSRKGSSDRVTTAYAGALKALVTSKIAGSFPGPQVRAKRLKSDRPLIGHALKSGSLSWLLGPGNRLAGPSSDGESRERNGLAIELRLVLSLDSRPIFIFSKENEKKKQNLQKKFFSKNCKFLLFFLHFLEENGKSLSWASLSSLS